jgi:hypothetical protein
MYRLYLSKFPFCFYNGFGLLVYITVLWIMKYFENVIYSHHLALCFLLQSPTLLRSEEYRQLFRLPQDEVSGLRVL